MHCSAFILKDPSSDKVRIRRAKHSHEYVVPSQFATIPTNHTQSRIMRNAHIKTHLRRPTSIKEQDEYETEDDDDHMPKTPIGNGDEDDDEDIPLAMLAFRKGFVVPNKVEHVYPLIQHVPQMVPIKRSDSYSSKAQSHINNHRFPMMYNYSAISPPMHYSENHPQQQPQQFYQLNRNYSYNSTLSSNSSASSLSCTSETIASSKHNYSPHGDHQVNSKTHRATSIHLHGEFLHI
ncbi:hypothetical protein V8B55DRAFT_1521876 [Mucor lusitanicus]|uniref:Uncharacterized protein n=2 Tax=Mucor circinelloides f. lusitanicus TaxID=29924 RepID=A0A168LJ19_MUCCL|nr:hypothetical protein FB192DRAFT_1393643 [Mucor lusitanicus]OAD03593.1 hypothetical protein MUCCIDRAFT_110463 [Mucor lusitanicus CBS 277.49]